MVDYGEIDLRWHLPPEAIKLHKFKIRFIVQMSYHLSGSILFEHEAVKWSNVATYVYYSF